VRKGAWSAEFWIRTSCSCASRSGALFRMRCRRLAVHVRIGISGMTWLLTSSQSSSHFVMAGQRAVSLCDRGVRGMSLRLVVPEMRFNTFLCCPLQILITQAGPPVGCTQCATLVSVTSVCSLIPCNSGGSSSKG